MLRTTKPCWRKARRTRQKAPKKAAERRVRIGAIRLEEMRFEPYVLEIPFAAKEVLLEQLRETVGLHRLKRVERTWYGVEQKKKRTRIFLLDHTGEQSDSASDGTERVKRCYERLKLARPKTISEARRCERVLFLVYDRLPPSALEEIGRNAAEWLIDESDRSFPFQEPTVRAYVELDSGRLYLPRCISDDAYLIGDYHYCVLRILEWLEL